MKQMCNVQMLHICFMPNSTSLYKFFLDTKAYMLVEILFGLPIKRVSTGLEYWSSQKRCKRVEQASVTHEDALITVQEGLSLLVPSGEEKRWGVVKAETRF